MRNAACLPLALLLGAAPSTVPPGTFETWGVHPVTPLSFTSGDIEIEVAATPCETPPQNEGCTWDGTSNQALVTVTAPGLPPFRMVSNRQASFVRVAAVRLAPGHGRFGAVVDNQWGGSAGLTEVTVVEPVPGGFRAVPLEQLGSRELHDEVKILPRRSGDGRAALALWTGGFNYSEECTACTRGVPLVLTVREGQVIDISADPAMRFLFARDLPARRRVCVSTIRERNGNCAAFVMDAARLGRIESAWATMLAHYRHEPAGYPAALRARLVKDGFLTRAVARALPLR